LTIVQATGGYYSFKNIPYAQPPVGDLRFRLPLPLLTINRTVNDGMSPRMCPQASPGYFQYSVPLVIGTILSGGVQLGQPAPSAPSPPVSEDCLLLDISVPKTIFDANAAGKVTKAPVLVFIHGGGYTTGSKEAVVPAPLIASSLSNGRTGAIIIGINYRL